MTINTISEKDYKKLLQEAEGLLFNYPHLEGTDIVSEVVLEFMEKDQNLYLHDLLKAVKWKAKNNSLNYCDSLKTAKFSISEQTRGCAKCHEPKPISEYSLVTRKKNKGTDAFSFIKEILYNCRDCQRIEAKKQYDRNKGNPEKRAAAKKAGRKYNAKKRKNRSLAEKRAYNEYMKAYRETPQWKEYLQKRRQKKIQEWL